MAKKITNKDIETALENDENYRKFVRDIRRTRLHLKQLETSRQIIEDDTRNQLEDIAYAKEHNPYDENGVPRPTENTPDDDA